MQARDFNEVGSGLRPLLCASFLIAEFFVQFSADRMRAEMKIAFLGLGIMGRPMAANLVKAGHEVTVWNRTPGKTVEGARSARVRRMPRKARKSCGCACPTRRASSRSCSA